MFGIHQATFEARQALLVVWSSGKRCVDRLVDAQIWFSDLFHLSTSLGCLPPFLFSPSRSRTCRIKWLRKSSHSLHDMRHSLQLVCHGIRTAASASAARPSTLAIASAAPRSGLCHYSQISQQRPRASLIVACCQFKLATPGASRSIATVTSHDGVKSTIPSSSKPIDAGRRTTKGEEDRGCVVDC